MFLRYSKFIVLISFCTLTKVNAQWQETSGPVSGHIRTFLPFGQGIYVGSGGGGIIKSLDNGDTWSFENTHIGSTDVKALVGLNNKIYAGTDEGVFVSADSGFTWNKTSLLHTYIKSMTVKGNIIFAGSYVKGMFRSLDEGASWQAVTNNLPDLYIYCLATVGNRIYAGTYQQGIYYSDDDGDSWTAANTGLTEMTIMSVIPSGNRLFAGTLSNGVFFSDDLGGHWSAVPGLNVHVKAMAVLGDTLFAGAMNGIYRSFDNGSTWTSVNNGLTETNIWGMGNFGSTIFAGTANGKVFRSNDLGGSWTCTNSNMVFKAVVGSIVKSNNNLLCASHGSGLFRTIDDGDTYIKDNSIGTVEIRSLGTMGTPVYAGTDLLGMFKSNNGGVSFSPINTGLTSTWVQSVAVAGSTVFAGTGEAGVFRSYNNGDNWIAVNDGLGSMDITALALYNSTVYAGTWNAGIYKSMDYGLNWTEMNNGLPSVRINCLFVFYGTLLCGTDDSGIYLFNEWDQIWQPFNLGLPANAAVRAISNCGSTPLVATSDNGVYAYFDTGNWEAFNEGLSNTQIRSLYVDDEYLFAGTNGGGIFRRPIGDIIIGIDELSDNKTNLIFPNPLTSHDILQIRNIDSPFTIEIFTAEGNRVFSRSVSENSIRLNTSTLKPGTYFIKIINQGKSKTQKLIII